MLQISRRLTAAKVALAVVSRWPRISNPLQQQQPSSPSSSSSSSSSISSPRGATTTKAGLRNHEPFELNEPRRSWASQGEVARWSYKSQALSHSPRHRHIQTKQSSALTKFTQCFNCTSQGNLCVSGSTSLDRYKISHIQIDGDGMLVEHRSNKPQNCPCPKPAKIINGINGIINNINIVSSG
uniref:HDC16610 n=1 Tax=Drosophila melanogaster TaxID=7227 RepID=Q6IIX6_DROME|nr:TPA_inf: HDC16610 [Drosophila melanogaster]